MSSRLGHPSANSAERLVVPYVAALAKTLVAKGTPAETLLDGVDTTLEALQQPDASLPLNDCVTLIDRLQTAGLTGNMVLDVAGDLDLRSHGFLGYAVLASSTLGDALSMAVRYLRTRTRLLVIRQFIDQDQVVVQFEEGIPLGNHFSWLIDGLMAALLNISRQMFQTLPPPEVTFRLSYAEQPHHQWLRQQAQGCFNFDAGFTQVRFPAQWLSLPVGTADPQLVKLAADQCERELARLEETEGLLGPVRHLAEQYLTETRSLDAVATALNMTPRTLRRRLAGLGTSFQQIMDELRRNIAVDKLLHSSISVEELAATLGYTDPSNFGRAFHRWTGLSPREYRRQRTSNR